MVETAHLPYGLQVAVLERTVSHIDGSVDSYITGFAKAQLGDGVLAQALEFVHTPPAVLAGQLALYDHWVDAIAGVRAGLNAALADGISDIEDPVTKLIDICRTIGMHTPADAIVYRRMHSARFGGRQFENRIIPPPATFQWAGRGTGTGGVDMGQNARANSIRDLLANGNIATLETWEEPDMTTLLMGGFWIVTRENAIVPSQPVWELLNEVINQVLANLSYSLVIAGDTIHQRLATYETRLGTITLQELFTSADARNLMLIRAYQNWFINATINAATAVGYVNRIHFLRKALLLLRAFRDFWQSPLSAMGTDGMARRRAWTKYCNSAVMLVEAVLPNGIQIAPAPQIIMAQSQAQFWTLTTQMRYTPITSSMTSPHETTGYNIPEDQHITDEFSVTTATQIQIGNWTVMLQQELDANQDGLGHGPLCDDAIVQDADKICRIIRVPIHIWDPYGFNYGPQAYVQNLTRLMSYCQVRTLQIWITSQQPQFSDHNRFEIMVPFKQSAISPIQAVDISYPNVYTNTDPVLLTDKGMRYSEMDLRMFRHDVSKSTDVAMRWNLL